MTYHHVPGEELEWAARNAITEFMRSDLQQYVGLTEEEEDILVSRLIRSFKEILPHRWQELVDVCNERNLQNGSLAESPLIKLDARSTRP